MLSPEQIEQLLNVVASYDRQTLLREFAAFRSHFPVDLTSEYLAALPEDRLRHIFAALCIQCRQMPRVPAELSAA